MGKDWYEGCTDDPYWRINHLYFIRNKDGQIARFKMNWAQEQLFFGMHTRNQVLKVRQLGISTLSGVMMLDSCTFHEHFHAGIIDKGLDDAQAKLKKIKLAYNFMLNAPSVIAVDHVEDEEDRYNIAMFAQAMAEKVKAVFTSESVSFTGNGSEIRVGTNLIGDTMDFLHVSEFGYTALYNPVRAGEIVAGGLETVPKTSIVIMESTHKGGKTGRNYNLIREAMRNNGRTLSPLDFKLFFFSWVNQEEYALEDGEPVTEERYIEYFAKLERNDGIKLTEAQKRWYVAKARTLENRIYEEYPTVIDEAFMSHTDGSIYGSLLMKLRAMTPTRIDVPFEADAYQPLYVSWDIGMSDFMTMWLFQVGNDGKYYVLDYYCAHDQPLQHYVNRVQAWEREYGQHISRHILPHDAGNRDRNGITFQQDLQKARFATVLLPRISNIWVGIQATKELMKHCVFHERCNKPVIVNGEEYPSGMNSLESYRTGSVGANGVERQEPLHDQSSHGADSFRYFAEAVKCGRVSKHQYVRRQADNGIFGEDDVFAEPKKKRDVAKGTPIWD